MEQQVGAALGSRRSAHQDEVGAEPLAGGVASRWSQYCKEVLMRGGEELSPEELRAERYHQNQMKQMEEKLKNLMEQQEKMSLELQEKKRLLVRKAPRSDGPPGSDPGSDGPPSSGGPPGSDGLPGSGGPPGSDPGSDGLPGSGVPPGSDHSSGGPPGSDPGSDGPPSSGGPPSSDGLPGSGGPPESDPGSGGPPPAAPFTILESPRSAQEASGSSGWPSDDVFLLPGEKSLSLRVLLPPQPEQNQRLGEPGRSPEGPRAEQNLPTSGPSMRLWPIQEASMEAGSLSSASDRSCSPMGQNREQTGHNPCDPEVRRRLLELCDITSCQDLYLQRCPLPAVEVPGRLDLGGDSLHIGATYLQRGSFSLYFGFRETGESVFMKVDSVSVPWDFYMFNRWRTSCPSADGVPLISCFLFEDGCITLYTPPPFYTFAVLMDPAPLSAGTRAVRLLQLVQQLHSCSLLHAGLQPSILVSCKRGPEDRLFPVDWSVSVDLLLQTDVTSAQQLLCSQTGSSLALLGPADPPHKVDLLGVAETIYFLLTNSRMVPVESGSGWTVTQFSGDGPCDVDSRTWTRFFQLLLNGAGRSSLSVLSELEELLTSVFR